MVRSIVLVRIPLLALATVAGCQSPAADSGDRRIDSEMLFRYERGPGEDRRFDFAHTLHYDSQSDYTNLRVFPMVSHVSYRPSVDSPMRIREQFGIEIILPLWHRETDENRYRIRVLSLFGFDYLTMFRIDRRSEALDDGGSRTQSDYTFLPYVGEGVSFFRLRGSELKGTAFDESTTGVDLFRLFWGEGFEVLEYRSTMPAASGAPPRSHTLNLGRALFGWFTIFRDHSIDGVESDFRLLGILEADPWAQSLFRVRGRKEPDGKSSSRSIEFLGPLVLDEEHADGGTFRIAPLFTFDREGSKQTLYLFHLIPIPW